MTHFRFTAIALVSSLALAPLASADWLQFRGPDRAGICSETGLLQDWNDQKPKLLWNTEGVGEGFAAVSIKGQGVIALNAANGEVLWSTTLTPNKPKHGYPGSRCTPTIDGDRLYVVTSDGRIACLKTDGSVVWQKEFEEEWNGQMMSGWGFSESPLVDGDQVVCTPGAQDAMLVALNKMTGEEIWRTGVPDLGENGRDGAGYCSMVISEACGIRQYVQLTGRGLIGVRADNGAFLWNYNPVANRVANISTPVVSGDYVFASTAYGTGSALVKLTPDGDGVKAEEVYFLKDNVFQNHHGGFVLVDGYIYAGHGHNAGTPICIKLDTGEVAWGGKDIEVPGDGSACVLYVDGNIIYRYQNGVVALVEATPEAYRLKGTFKPVYIDGPSWAYPVVDDGILYLREKGRVMAYSLKP
jgi:outer membrane protein assembly factor BamB